jgi:hypothetical protein
MLGRGRGIDCTVVAEPPPSSTGLPVLLGPIAELVGGFPLGHWLQPLLIHAAKFPAQRKKGRGLDWHAGESPHWGMSKCKPQLGEGGGAWKLPGNQRASSVQLRQAK